MIALMLLTACEYEAMSPAWLVDRTRVLAVSAEVVGQPGLAEPRPGDTVTFQSLVVSPDHEHFGVTWMGCLPEDANDFGCEVDLDEVEALFDQDLEELSTQELLELLAQAQELGLLGIEPYLPPSLQVPAEVLDDLTEEERLEGLNYFLTVSAFPLTENEEGELVEVEGLEDDEDLVELAYKRMPVSEATTPNHNPELTALQVDGYPMAADQVVHVTAGQTYSLDPILGETAIEQYEYTTSDGVVETRTEEPYFTFYATGGSLAYNASLYPHSAVDWVAPDDEPGSEHRVWAVVRDRRGGMAWWTLDLVVEGGS